MKQGVVITVALIMLMIPGALLAQGTCSQKMVYKEAAGLDREQSAKIEKLHVEHSMEIRKLEAELEVLRLKMEKMLMKDRPSERRLERIASKISTLRKKIEKHRLEQMIKIRMIAGHAHWNQISTGGCGMNAKGCAGMTGCCGCMAASWRWRARWVSAPPCPFCSRQRAFRRKNDRQGPHRR